MRIIADTNVLISSLFWNGVPCKIIESVIDGKLELVTSPSILAEVRSVLRDEKEFGLSEQEVDDVLSVILSYATLTEPTIEVLHASRDPKDNHVLAAAQNANVDRIVTRDKDLLTLKTYLRIRIQTPEAFYTELQQPQS